MVGVFPSGNLDSRQYSAERPSMGDWPHTPLALKSCVTMLDSGGMPDSEDKPPTLASLRARRGKLRLSKGPSSATPGSDSLSQAGLFSAVNEAQTLDHPAVKL